jgi:hypothetical protein
MNTQDLVKAHQEWLEKCTSPFRLTSVEIENDKSYHAIHETEHETAYEPSKELFSKFYHELQIALSRSPAQSRYSLKRGYFVVNWSLWGDGERHAEIVATGTTITEFASLYAAMKHCPGYSNRPMVHRDKKGFLFMSW